EGRPHRQHAMEQEPEDERYEEAATERPVDVERQVAGVAAGEPDAWSRAPPACGELDGDLRPGVAASRDEHVSRAELSGIAVVPRVELDDVRAEIPREERHPRPLVARHRHHDLVG